MFNPPDIHRQHKAASPLGDRHTIRKMLRIAVLGVAVNSSFGQRLAAALSGVAELIPGGSEPIGWLWRHYLRGTALEHCGHGEPDAAKQAQPDLVLDLLGSNPSSPVRTWQVVDGFGNPVLRPFGCLAEADTATSLYLVESRPGLRDSFVLAEAGISTRRRYRDVLDAAGWAAIWLVAKAIQAPPLQPAVFKCVTRRPSVTSFAAGRIAHVKAWMRDRIGSEVWAIGFIKKAPHEFLESNTIEPDYWVKVPRETGFVADPFILPSHQGAFLCEHYTHRGGRGTLAAYFPDEAAGGTVRQLDIPVIGHLSYPFTFVEADTTYCLPEMAEARYQGLYVLQADGSLREHSIIADHVMMADPTLFRYDGLYWIAYSDVAGGVRENLCLQFAERLEGPWVPHPRNPVKLDVRSSRPGGTPFWYQGALFRPAQDCSASYGHALVINRVVVCTRERYEERPVAWLAPEPNGPYPHGRHTFSVTPHGVLLDGKVVIFSGRIMWQRLQRRLRRAIRGRASKSGFPEIDRSDGSGFRSAGKASCYVSGAPE